MADEQSSPTEGVNAEATSTEAFANGQPEAASTSPQQPDGFVSETDFKKMQSILDKRAALAESRAKELDAKVRELSLQSVPEDQRQTVQLQQQLEQQAAELAQFQREAALRRLSSDYGVPYDTIATAAEPQEAWGMSLQHMKSEVETLRAQLAQYTGGQASQSAPSFDAPQTAQTPFIAPAQAGGSKARDWEKEFNEAMAAGDVRTYNQLRRELEASQSG